MEHFQFLKKTQNVRSRTQLVELIGNEVNELYRFFEANPRAMLWIWQQGKLDGLHVDLLDFTPERLAHVLKEQWEDPAHLFAVIFPDGSLWSEGNYSITNLNVLVQFGQLAYYMTSVVGLHKFGWTLGRTGRNMANYLERNGIPRKYWTKGEYVTPVKPSSHYWRNRPKPRQA